MVSAKHRRLRKLHKQRKERVQQEVVEKKHVSHRTGLDKFYHEHYKPLFFVTIAFLMFALITIGVTYAQTGEIFHKGVSLSGGLTITIPTESPVDILTLETELIAAFPDADFVTREVSDLGTQSAIIIEAAPPRTDAESLRSLEQEILAFLETGIPDVKERASTELIGSALGQSFFQQTAKAVLIAFAFMGMVVFLYFGETLGQKVLVVFLTLLEGILIWYASGILVGILAAILGIILILLYVRFSIPSAAVILAAVSTIIFTIAVVNIMGMRISTAGIAAFLMLIGYSVDTDILLSTRVRGGRESSEWPSPEEGYNRLVGALKTGMTMEITTLIAALVALIFTQSDVIREIMTIVFIGLVADIFFTWIQNAGILRIYLEKRSERSE